MNNKERFSNRVDDYVKFRPTYPKEAINFLYDEVGFNADSVIADLGSGTGIFSKLLLDRGSEVIGIEPNKAMGEAAITFLNGEERYRHISGAAEETGIPSHSVDFIVSAQAYHWFDREAAKLEFQRILKPGGKVVLIWNVRKEIGSPFLEQYENLIRTFGTDYEQVAHKSAALDSLRPYFAKDSLKCEQFCYEQLLDERGLRGRLLSASYIPAVGHPNYEPMIAELSNIFEKSQKGGVVVLDYVTELYWGEV
ncbi:class I SAM-dependent methyltransferase [Paenibacillus sp. GSMTC-2017]|uniref:class I SAM-dependent methyltransferase n=1 Tax=Paenibacillus sp. GSMTC-2017 TaxID=2794350 RepID=UPI0018D652DE|nr:class I SAM-dependent methyltransferase [Paenibacillus sp. GSMTC-2017]MBH5317110.1 class I SAM-dependent methyltransferase [Paenibacillus sp. GSMTC-2017]